jgi:hypothetical protein
MPMLIENRDQSTAVAGAGPFVGLVRDEIMAPEFADLSWAAARQMDVSKMLIL